MHIFDLLNKDYFILFLTKFLNITEIQNVLISFNLKENIHLYFMRECLSLMNFENNEKEEQEFLKVENELEEKPTINLNEQKRKKNKEETYMTKIKNNYIYEGFEFIDGQDVTSTVANEEELGRSNEVADFNISTEEITGETLGECNNAYYSENHLRNLRVENYSFESDFINSDKDSSISNEEENLECDKKWNKTPIGTDIMQDAKTPQINEDVSYEKPYMQLQSYVELTKTVEHTMDDSNIDRTKTSNKIQKGHTNNYSKTGYCISEMENNTKFSEEREKFDEQIEDSDAHDFLLLKKFEIDLLININTDKWKKLKKYVWNDNTIADVDINTLYLLKKNKIANYLFSNIWTYLHMNNGAINIQKKLNHFYEIDVYQKVKKNYENVKFDWFQIFLYKNQYYTFYDMPWAEIYYSFNLNSICISCQEKIIDTENCTKIENIPLYKSNRILLKHFVQIDEEEIKEEENNYWENSGDLLIETTDTYKFAHINNKEGNKRKKETVQEKPEENNHQKISSLENKSKKRKTHTNEELELVKMTHVLCECCSGDLEYKSDYTDLIESIKCDLKILHQYSLIKTPYGVPEFDSFICNYFYFKKHCDNFISESVEILKHCGEKLRKHYQNILLLSFNYYDNVTKVLLSCNDEKVRRSQNIFLNAFYAKHKKGLHLFHSPRIAFIKNCFLLLQKELPKFLICFKCVYFLKLAKILSVDAMEIIKKLCRDKNCNETYDSISKYLYAYLTPQLLKKKNFKEAYNFFTHIIMKFFKENTT